MTKKQKAAPRFGAIDGPGFSALRLASGELVVGALSRWRRQMSENGHADETNLGWLDRVYLVPTPLARSWAQFESLDLLATESGKKKLRLRGVVKLDGKEWAVTGGVRRASPDAPPEMDLEHVALTELIDAEAMSASSVGRLYTFAERFAPEVTEVLGRNFRGIGPVFAKAGNEPLALGFNARVLPVEGLELGQWFALDLPRLEAAA